MRGSGLARLALLAVGLAHLPPAWGAEPPGETAADTAAAALEGPPGLVLAVARGLAQRGLSTSAGTGGADLQVTISQEPTGIRVVLRDRDGRGTERLVATVEVAAALIESWARPDLVDPLLVGKKPPSPPPSPQAVPLASEPQATPGGLPRLRLGLESAVGSDRSLWWGASLGGCLTWGRLCLGLQGRFAANDAGESAARFRETTPATLDRLALEAMIGVDSEVTVGGVRLGVGAGLGLGRIASDVRLDDFGRQVSALGPRAELRIGLGIEVASRVHLDLELGVALAPTARREPSTAGYFTVPGDPLGQLRLGLGARWGR
jgi:hypothetical protein